jgi:hypothetical protein
MVVSGERRGSEFANGRRRGSKYGTREADGGMHVEGWRMMRKDGGTIYTTMRHRRLCNLSLDE